jgi:predicted amidohydrolase YtcJ
MTSTADNSDADIVLTGGNILTLDADLRRAEAIAI